MERPDHSPADAAEAAWAAPRARGPLDAEVRVPGSKSLAARGLVLAALADGPSVIRRPLRARDTALMQAGLEALGVGFRELDGDALEVTPPARLTGPASIDCGLAGTVMRFLPAVAALATGRIAFDGDAQARRRPMSAVLDALEGLGVEVERGEVDGAPAGGLPFAIHGTGSVTGGELEIDASASSQFVSALLLAAPRFAHGLTLRHAGERLPSLPHIEMTIECLRARGVDAETTRPGVWHVEPGPIAAEDAVLEPDLSNAEPFLIAAIVAGGEVRIPGWPERTTQPGALLEGILPRFGARVRRTADGALACDGGAGVLGGARFPGLQLDLGPAGELAPNLAALCALAGSPSRLVGIGHLRGHETDRLAALAAELRKLGARVDELEDGLAIEPPERLAEGVRWESYEDHRMATSGAILGLAAEGLAVDDIACTSKTMPEFPRLWAQMLGAVAAPGPEAAS